MFFPLVSSIYMLARMIDEEKRPSLDKLGPLSELDQEMARRESVIKRLMPSAGVPLILSGQASALELPLEWHLAGVFGSVILSHSPHKP
jgi:hypothetical protein